MSFEMFMYMRHFESEKNILKQFSSADNLEQLTEEGKQQGMQTARAIADFVERNSLLVSKVYCANSVRAKLSADFIANQLKISSLPFDELCSNNSGSLRGVNEVDAQASNPLFMKQLKLFRAGIFSSYNFVKVHNREDKYAFEQRVNQCIQNIINKDKGDLQIFVMHHSSLTAAVIKIAREIYGYPTSFYGHVACELGNCYLINHGDILLCNEPIAKLAEIKL